MKVRTPLPSLTPEQQARMQAAAEKAFVWSDAANREYLESRLSRDWAEGVPDRINAL